jgi:uridylate kinase
MTTMGIYGTRQNSMALTSAQIPGVAERVLSYSDFTAKANFFTSGSSQVCQLATEGDRNGK